MRLQLYTETMRFLDGDYPSHTFFWRQLRVKYYDNTEWNDNLKDRGKVLESSLSCRDSELLCNCSSSNYFDFAWDGTRLVHIDEDGIKRSIGPSPLRGAGQATLTLRQFNLRLKESKLTAEFAHTYRRPTSTTTTITSTTESTTARTTSRTWSTTSTFATKGKTTTTTMADTSTDTTSAFETEDEETTEEFTTTSGDENDADDESDTQDGDDYDAPQTEGSASATTSQSKGAKQSTKSTTKSTTPPSGARVTTTAATTTAAAATTTGAGGSAGGSAKTTKKPTTTKEKDEDEAEDWDTKPRGTSVVTTTTTTLFCHCYVNVTWRSEAHGMAPAGPLGEKKLRRATVPHSISGKLGGCRKFCIQDNLVRVLATLQTSTCRCTTSQQGMRRRRRSLAAGAWRRPTSMATAKW